MKKVIITLLCTLIFGNFSVAQQLTRQQKKVVDSLTQHWGTDDKPGGAIAFIHKNELLFQNTRGLSNVVNGQKLTPNTPFQIAQLSDSFIAFAILKLHYDGKLSLEDPVKKYIPELKNLSSKITINHLLQQSSGLHDFEVLKNIAGWEDSEPFDIQDALNLLVNQESSSFEPGAEFAYSRSNMLVAAIIIEQVSEKEFSTYMKDDVFTPLKMNNSYVLTAKNQNESSFAKSYRSNEDGTIVLTSTNKGNYASINLVTSIADMSKWEQNLMSPTKNTQKTVSHFNSFVQLENGKYYSVPRGKLTYGQKYIHKERGIDTAMSTGGIDGFAAAIFNFPSEEFTVITLSNNGESYNGYIGMLSAHEILDDAFLEPTSIDFNELKTVPLDLAYHKKYEGTYWDALGEISREIRIENDTLRYVRSETVKSALIPLTKNKFQMKTDFDDKIILDFSDKNGTTQMLYHFGEATPFLFEKYKIPAFAKADLEKVYTGTYYCKALNKTYIFKIEDGKLMAQHNDMKIAFNPITNKIFSGNQWYMGSIAFEFDSNDTAKGFYVKNDAIRNLWFQKK